MNNHFRTRLEMVFQIVFALSLISPVSAQRNSKDPTGTSDPTSANVEVIGGNSGGLYLNWVHADYWEHTYQSHYEYSGGIVDEYSSDVTIKERLSKYNIVSHVETATDDKKTITFSQILGKLKTIPFPAFEPIDLGRTFPGEPFAAGASIRPAQAGFVENSEESENGYWKEQYGGASKTKVRLERATADESSQSYTYFKTTRKSTDYAILDAEPLTLTIPARSQTSAEATIETAEPDQIVSLFPVDITVAFGLGAEPLGPRTSRELLESYLETISVRRIGDIWFVKYTDVMGLDKFHGIEIVTAKEKLIDALKRPGQVVVFDGHANFGLGPNFSGKVTHKTLADFTHFGTGKTAIPKIYRGNGTETDVTSFTLGNGTTLPTNPQDLAAIDRIYAEGWAYLNLLPSQIFETAKNDFIDELEIQRFENLQGVGPRGTFEKVGNGFNNEWHFDNPDGQRRIIVQAPSTDLPSLGYSKFFYNACNTGRDYIQSFKHKDFFYTKDSCKVETATTIFVRGIIEGKINDEILAGLNQNGVGNVGNQSKNIYGVQPY